MVQKLGLFEKETFLFTVFKQHEKEPAKFTTATVTLGDCFEPMRVFVSHQLRLHHIYTVPFPTDIDQDAVNLLSRTS